MSKKDFKVGQVWTTTNGSRIKIVDIYPPGSTTYPIIGERVDWEPAGIIETFTEVGHYWSVSEGNGLMDLVTLVEDVVEEPFNPEVLDREVDIGWTWVYQQGALTKFNEPMMIPVSELIEKRAQLKKQIARYNEALIGMEEKLKEAMQ